MYSYMYTYIYTYIYIYIYIYIYVHTFRQGSGYSYMNMQPKGLTQELLWGGPHTYIHIGKGRDIAT